MMPILQAPGVMTPGQLGPIKRTHRVEAVLHDQHVEGGNPLGDADDQFDAGFGGFENRVLAETRWPVDDGSCRAGFSFTASCTVLNTGRSRCVVPPLPGVTPPAKFVP